MHRDSIRRRMRLVVVMLTFSLTAIPVDGLADGWADDAAAESTADDIEDHEEGAEDPDRMTTGSHDPDSMTVESGTMDTRMADSEDPDKMVVGVDEMDEASSEGLTDLKRAKPDVGYIALEIPGQSEWQSTTNARVLVARKNLLRAEARARAARTAYGNMMESDYPRGQSRIRIVTERDDSMKAFEEAKQALDAVQGPAAPY